MSVVQVKVPALLAIIALATISVPRSGPGEDRPGSVEVEPESETVSGTGTGTGTATGAVSPGEIYTPVSNVDGYFNFALDLRDIKDAIASGDWDGAAAIYENGKGFVRSDGTLPSINPSDLSELESTLRPLRETGVIP